MPQCHRHEWGNRHLSATIPCSAPRGSEGGGLGCARGDGWAPWRAQTGQHLWQVACGTGCSSGEHRWCERGGQVQVHFGWDVGDGAGWRGARDVGALTVATTAAALTTCIERATQRASSHQSSSGEEWRFCSPPRRLRWAHATSISHDARRSETVLIRAAVKRPVSSALTTPCTSWCGRRGATREIRHGGAWR